MKKNINLLKNFKLKNLSIAKKETIKIFSSGFLYLFIVIMFLISAVGYVNNQKKLILNQHQKNLRIVLESRAAEINKWFDKNLSALDKISDNPALKLYMTSIINNGTSIHDMEKAYLNSLIEHTAITLNYFPEILPKINAGNENLKANQGLALINKQGEIIVSTTNMPDLTLSLIQNLKRSVTKNAIEDVYINENGVPVIGFIVPITKIQTDLGNSKNTIGYILGIKKAEELYDMLNQPGDTLKTAKNYLIRRSGNSIEYISPLENTPLMQNISVNTDIASVKLSLNPDNFGIFYNINDTQVLGTAKRIEKTKWILIRTVDRYEALEKADNRLLAMLIILILVILGTAFAFIAVWRHGASVRAAEALSKYKKSTAKLEEYIEFLHVIANAQSDEIMVLDKYNKFVFVDKQFMQRANLEYKNIINKPMAHILGPELTKRFCDLNVKTREMKKPVIKIHKLEENGQIKIYKSYHIPLANDNVLMTLHDLTDIMKERDNHEQIMEKIIEILVNHICKNNKCEIKAKYNKEITEIICKELNLAENDTQTAKLISLLADFRKDKNIINSIKEIDFGLPVIKALNEIDERWDGKGKNKLSKEKILISARIVTIASNFVNEIMTIKNKKDEQEVRNIMHNIIVKSDKEYDPKIVSAFMNYLNNKDGLNKIIKLFSK